MYFIFVYFLKKDFEYVLDKKSRSNVCFGSGVVREVLPKSGSSLSPFMSAMGACKGSALGPYEDLPIFSDPKRKPSSNVGSFNKSLRWVPEKSYQAPRRKPKAPKVENKAFAPFNQSSSRKLDFVINSNPGPGTYKPSDKKREMKFYHSFNGKKILVPAVDIKCVPFNEDVCSQCGTLCGEQGDYWHIDNKVFLCRECIEKFERDTRRHKKFDPRDFKPIRDCSFAHHHELFKNAMILMNFRQIRKRVYKEAYLNMYFSQLVEKKYT
ncbi:uncharacterized protein LOC143913384 [Arctopsyche grandis]|uniref:uncharacterized protein LOC143913384 n=1 Tax=Arctopsyche grandis TaxID=121162 RepID=UPI00406D9573